MMPPVLASRRSRPRFHSLARTAFLYGFIPCGRSKPRENALRRRLRFTGLAITTPHVTPWRSTRREGTHPAGTCNPGA